METSIVRAWVYCTLHLQPSVSMSGYCEASSLAPLCSGAGCQVVNVHPVREPIRQHPWRHGTFLSSEMPTFAALCLLLVCYRHPLCLMWVGTVATSSSLPKIRFFHSSGISVYPEVYWAATVLCCKWFWPLHAGIYRVHVYLQRRATWYWNVFNTKQ